MGKTCLNQRFSDALPPVMPGNSHRRERYRRDHFPVHLDIHPAESNDAGQFAAVFIVSNEREHHVTVDTELLDETRLIRLGKGTA